MSKIKFLSLLRAGVTLMGVACLYSATQASDAEVIDAVGLLLGLLTGVLLIAVGSGMIRVRRVTRGAARAILMLLNLMSKVYSKLYLGTYRTRKVLCRAGSVEISESEDHAETICDDTSYDVRIFSKCS